MRLVTRPPAVQVDLPGLDPQQTDHTGRPWVFLDEAPAPSVVVAGAVVVGGEPDWPVLVRVADVTLTGSGRRMHVDVLGVLSPAPRASREPVRSSFRCRPTERRRQGTSPSSAPAGSPGHGRA
jgi:hypothetical protein